MKSRLCTLIALLLFVSFTHAQPGFIVPGDNLVVEGVPKIPTSLAAEVARYTEFRQATLHSWHPKRREMLIGTRFADTAQVHLLNSPGGARTQLTFFRDSVPNAAFAPYGDGYFTFSKDTGGSEFYQNYRFDRASGNVTLLTDGKSRNSFGVSSSHCDGQVAYTSTRRTGKDVDLYVIDPQEAKSDRLLAQFRGGGWQPLGWSHEDDKILMMEYVSINETYLWSVDAKTGKATPLTPSSGPKVAYLHAAFDHDDKGLFVVSDRDGEFQQLSHLDLATGKHTPLTKHIPWDVTEFAVTRNGKWLAFVTNENGVGVLRLLDPATGKELPAPKLPPGSVSKIQWHDNNRDLGFTLVSARHPMDVFSLDVTTGKVERWTQSETGGLNTASFAEPKLIRWKSFDGLEVSGFLYNPPAQFKGKRPVIIDIHGGPESQFRPMFLGRKNYFLNEMGVAIIFPNIRGSAGYGKSFLQLDNGFLRTNAYKDIGALLDWIRTQPDLDAERIMVTGGSYGGHMTLAVATLYDDKIRCSVDVVGMSNLVTFLENTEGYRRDLRRAEYGDERDEKMRKFLESIAPLHHAHKINRPLFVIQGKNDPRVPYTESEQMLATVRKNKTPVWYLLAKDEGHGFAKKRNADFQFYATIMFMREHLLSEVPPAKAQKEPAKKTAVAEEIANEIKPLFEELGKAFAKQDGNRLAKVIDVERMTAELLAVDSLPAETRQDPVFINATRTGIMQSFVKQGPVLAFERFDIKNVKKLNATDAVVIIRHHKAGDGTTGNLGSNVTLKMRWWISKQKGTWRIHDMEDLDTGVRITTSLISMGAAALDNMPEIAPAVVKLQEAMMALHKNLDADAADMKLRQIAGVKLPKRYEAYRFMVTGLVHIRRLQHAEALKAFDQAETFNPDMPCLDLFRGYSCNYLGQWARAFKHLSAYEALLGEDTTTCEQRAISLRGLYRFKDAAAAYRQALDIDPQNATAYLGLLQALESGEKRDDLGPRFVKLRRPHENFAVFFEDCKSVSEGASLIEIAQAMRKIDPKHAPADLALAFANVWSKRIDEAMPFFQAALAKQKDVNLRQRHMTDFMQALIKADRIAEAYTALPDAREAFRFLALELKRSHRMNELADLVARHGKNHADDPLLAFCQGQIHFNDGDYELADKAFARGMLKPPDQSVLHEFRVSQVQVGYELGKAMKTYADVGPKRDTFLQLANLCWDDRSFDLLTKLLDQHAMVEPDSPDVGSFRIRMKIRQNQLKQAIAEFKAVMATQRQPEIRRSLTSSFLMEMVDADKGFEGYRAVDDARLALQIVVPDLLSFKKLEAARQVLELHRSRHADDPNLNLYVGQLLIHEKSWIPAIDIFREGRRDAAPEMRPTYDSFYVQALYRAGRGLKAYEEVEPRLQTYLQLVNLHITDRKGKELLALTAAHQRHVGDDADVFFDQARAHFFLKQPGEAIDLFRKAYQKQKDIVIQQDYVRQFVFEMQALDRSLDAYRAVPDKKTAFRNLAPNLFYKKQEMTLASLLAEHGKEHATDGVFLQYRGELHLMRGQFAEAERDLTAALAKLPPEDQWSPRNSLQRLKIKAGKVVALYKELGGKKRDFESLGNLCFGEKNAQQLAELLAAHRQAHPDDVGLPSWEFDVHWLKQDYQTALDLLNQHRQGIFSMARYRWKREQYTVRCLVKLKRYKEAIEEAQALARTKNPSALLTILAHAAAGDVKTTEGLLEKHQKDRYLLEDCYRDDDLGPILRSEPFRALRERFPAPKMSNPEDSID